MSAGPNYLLHPEALQTQYRACSLVLAMEVPCSWAMGLKRWGAPAVDPVTPWGRGTGTGDWTRLRSIDKLRHKPLCFGFPHERWQCLAPAISSGVLQFKQSCCSLETPPPQCDPGCYKCFMVVYLAWMSSAVHRESIVGQGQSKGFLMHVNP